MKDYDQDKHDKKKKIFSENPEFDIWKSLLRYSYPANIRKYIQIQHGTEPTDDFVNLISGAITQAEAYFKASKVAPLDISPLLTYYGSINLLAASCHLKENQPLNIKGHGIKLRLSNYDRDKIGDIKIMPNNSSTGCIQIFSKIFSHGLNFNSNDLWTIRELFGSIPDLKNEFEHCYGEHSFVIPVEIIKTRGKIIEIIHNDEVISFNKPIDWLKIKNFQANYLRPQQLEERIVLNRKINFSDCGIYSISGKKYLEVGHLKSGDTLYPGLIISSIMGLYALSFLSRYVAEIWTPFVRADKSGEKLLIEKFLITVQRQIPNLALNLISNSSSLYVSEVYGITDLTSVYTEGDIQEIVQEKLNKIIKERNLRL